MELKSSDVFENLSRLPTGGGGMFICSKLEQNLSEMEVRTFVGIQRVIWDQLWANYAVCSVFFFVLSSSPPRSVFRLNRVRKVRKRCSHSMFSFDNSRIFWPKCRLELFVFFGCYGRPWLFSLSQVMMRGKKISQAQKGDRTQIVQGPFAGSPPSRPPLSHSKANLGITYSESLFAGYPGSGYGYW